MLKPGSLLKGRYILGRALGMGGFGITYLAYDSVGKSHCAVKEYLPTQIAARDTRNSHVLPGSAGDKDIYVRGIKLFAQEAQMLSSFAGNNAIVQVWDFFEDNNTAYFVMEFLDGVTLKTLIRSMNGRLPLNFATDIFTGIGKALSEVHKKGMLHRDVSPENIMITKKGAFKLIDFGATRFFVGEKSKSLSVVLKPGFAPPEQYSSRGNQGPWVDVYALAATFYLSISGVLLPDATDRLAGVAYAPLHTLEASLGKRASDAIDKALALNYKQRYQSMNAFIDALFPSGGAAAPSTPPPAARPQPRSVQPPRQPVSSPPPTPAYAGHMRGTPCLLELRGGSVKRKWLLPKNMDMAIGTAQQKNNIILKIPGGDVACALRYDEKQGCFYIWNHLGSGVYLRDGTPLIQNKVFPLKAGDQFYLHSGDNLYQVEVE
jgi:serine/threonine protein kinase